MEGGRGRSEAVMSEQHTHRAIRTHKHNSGGINCPVAIDTLNLKNVCICALERRWGRRTYITAASAFTASVGRTLTPSSVSSSPLRRHTRHTMKSPSWSPLTDTHLRGPTRWIPHVHVYDDTYRHILLATFSAGGKSFSNGNSPVQ